MTRGGQLFGHFSQLIILMYGFCNHFSYEHNNLNTTDSLKTTVEHGHRLLHRIPPSIFSSIYSFILLLFDSIVQSECTFEPSAYF